jgi:ribonucleoside-diphosphate reductase alpha chain
MKIMVINADEKKPLTLKETLLHSRYLRKDGDGQVCETVDDMYRRVAKVAASVEEKYGADQGSVDDFECVFYALMSKGMFLPNSPTLMNAGRAGGVLSACYVLPVGDSIESIFDATKNTALIQKAGGGTGCSFDLLRPTGDLVTSSGGQTSGPISFLRVLSETSHAIQQGAHRRGASMTVMSVHHPDVLRFITAKQDTRALTNFNISIKMPDAFMACLQNTPDKPHVVTNPRTNRDYWIPRGINPQTYRIQDLVPVQDHDSSSCMTVGDIWNTIVQNAHATGEPGLIFIDRVNRDNPTPHIGSISATNPCGEQPLLDYESCNLGSLNLSAFVRHDGSGTDWQALKTAVWHAVRFLDNIIDVNSWPIEEIRQATLGNRKIGLGVMGVADALALLGIRYDSGRAVEYCRRVGWFIQEQAHEASQSYAQERGKFANWQGSIWDIQHQRPMRNAACTTIAPTGSISIIAECSSGIEPIYNLAYRRRAMDGQEFVQIHPLLEKIGRAEGWLGERVTNMLLEGCAPRDIPEIPERLSEILVTAHEIAPEWHVKIQATFQTHVDNAVSKTVNLPHEVDVKEVDRVFQLAYSLGCKGVTVYRDGSRQGQVVSSLGAKDSNSTAPRSGLRPRNSVTTGQTSKFRMGCGTLFVTVNRDADGICEVFANLGKAGGCPSQSEATCRAVSAALRSGVNPEIMIDQLSGIRCLSAAVARKTNKEINVLSCPDAIACALKEALGQADVNLTSPFRQICEECGHSMRREANCVVCNNCGDSKCG